MPYVVVSCLSESPKKASWPTLPGFGTSGAISADMVCRSQTHTHRGGGGNPDPKPHLAGGAGGVHVMPRGRGGQLDLTHTYWYERCKSPAPNIRGACRYQSKPLRNTGTSHMKHGLGFSGLVEKPSCTLTARHGAQAST